MSFTPLFFTQFLRACTAIFAACYLLFLLTTFLDRRPPRLRLCAVFWVGLFLQYVASFIGARLELRTNYWFIVAVIAFDVIQLAALVWIAETLPLGTAAAPRHLPLRVNKLMRVAVVVVGIAVIAAAMRNPSGRLVDALQSLFGFIAISWFTLRWALAVPRRLLYLAFPLMLYATSYLLLFGSDPSNDSLMRVVLSIINLAVYVALAFACFYTLSDPKPRTAPMVAIKKHSASQAQPELKLDNLWAFLYLAYREPSGKAAVFALAAACLAIATSGLPKFFGAG